MADATSSAAEIVNDKYDRSIDLANEATVAVEGFQEALNNSIYTPATISARWETLPAPQLPEVGNIPTLPNLALVVPDGKPGDLTAEMVDVPIDDFTDEAPVLSFGQLPVMDVGDAPLLPELREVAIPDAPDVNLPDAPEFLTLTTQTFGGVDLHEDWLDKLDDIPTLTLLEPAPFTYSPGARYASQLLDSLKATLNARIHGGTGLNPQVEANLWGRALDRETAVALAREQDILRQAESLGFPLPSGVLTGQLRDAAREYNDKISGLSRDISIKQAELEQENLKQATDTAVRLETVLLEDTYKLELLAFDAAKTTAENAIQVHNASIEYFKALLDGYRSYASVYETIIRAEMNKVEVFKALLSAEQIKAEINKSLVDRYTAEIEGAMAGVEIYKARVSAAQTLVELERTRIQAGGEQIKAFVATISAKTAEVDLYKASVDAESTKMEAYRTRVQAFGMKVGAQGEKARAEVAKYQALISAKQLEWDGWKAELGAAVAEVEAATKKSSMIVDGFRIGAHATEAQAMSYMRRWEADIAQYQAGQNITFTAAKINAEAVQHANDARMEAAKVGLTTSSQRLASAWAMVSASAQIQGSATLNQTI